MSTTKKIIDNTVIQIVGKIISTFLGLLAIGLMTRYLGTEQFGWYITTVTFLQFVGILIDFGLVPVSAQMLSEPKFKKTNLLKNLLGFRFVSAIFFLGLAPLLVLFFPYPKIIKQAIAIMAVSFVAIAMNQVLVAFYQTKLKMYVQATGEVVGRIVLLTGLWLLIKGSFPFLFIIGIITVSGIAHTAVIWIWAFKYTRPTLKFEWKIWQEIIKKMWPVAISIIFNVVYLKGDALLLSLFRTQTEVGLYGAAYRVIDILSQVAMMVMGVILPILAYNWSRNLKEEFRKRYQQAFDMMMALAIPVAFGTIFLAEKIMVLVAGKDFASSAKPLQILSIAVFGLFFGAVFGHIAVSINKQKQVMWIYISDAIITLIGYLIFIPLYGMYGAAFMTVFSEFYAGILLYFAIKKYSRERLKFKIFFKIIFASIIMTISLAMFKNLHVLYLVFIGGLVYSISLFSIGGISKETIKEALTLKKGTETN